jgi:hypothetical protein
MHRIAERRERAGQTGLVEPRPDGPGTQTQEADMSCTKLTLARCMLAAAAMAASLARADVISEWNTIALDTVTRSGRYRAYEESRVMAMVNTAMSEAIRFNEGRGPSRLLVTPPRPLGASSEAAAATTAHYILVQLHPEQKATLDAALERSLATVADTSKRESGRMMGISLGMNLYALLR